MTGRAAVLVGTATYANFQPVPAAANSLELMRGLLTGPLCGWQDDEVTVLADESVPGDIPARLMEAFEAVTDVALFYFVGHGQPDTQDQLCLALTQSRREPTRRRGTSLEFAAVRYAMHESRARVKVVLLDCCSAGLATEDPGILGDSAPDLDRLVRRPGAYLVAACGPFESARYETGPGNPRPYTYFTKSLAEIVRGGPFGDSDVLTLDQLAYRLMERLDVPGHNVPTVVSWNDAGTLPFARYRREDRPVPVPGSPPSRPASPQRASPAQGLPEPIRYDHTASPAPAGSRVRGPLLPDVPSSVWSIADAGRRAAELLQIGYRLADVDPAQARQVLARAEQVLHEDVAPGFIRYRLLLEAAMTVRSSRPDWARRFLGLAATAYADAPLDDPLLAGAPDELRRLGAALASP
jgi:hypothetical protein